MFECFKSKVERMRIARRLTLASKRYEQIAGLLGPGKDEEKTFEEAKEIIARASTIENESCGCEMCAWLRLRRRGQVTK